MNQNAFRNRVSFQKQYRTIIVILLIGLVSFALTTQYDKLVDANITSDLHAQSLLIMEWKLTENISCHNQMKEDALPLLGKNFTPHSNSIFMHETSCRGGINSRQACSVESAARANPNWNVFVLFSGPVSRHVLARSCLAILLKYNNVKLLRINLTDYAKGTPVQGLVESNPIKRSKWRVEHSSDVLRYLTLFKFGGVYMDTDMVVMKSLDSLGDNWAARESNIAVDSGVMSFSRDPLGRKIANATIQDFISHYNPRKWGNNGPGVITRVVKSMCSKNNKKWIEGCQGFKVYEPAVFYPVYYRSNKQYFKANYPLATSDKTFAHHMWNALTYKYKVPTTSPYAKLAKKYCPKVYEMYGNKFGV